MISGPRLRRLYPKRSITSHRFCGSGRLFRLFKDEARRAESGMAELSSCGLVERFQTRATIFRRCPDVKRILQNGHRSQAIWQTLPDFRQEPRTKLQIGQVWTLTLQTRF